VLGRILEELHDFAQLVLGLVHPGHIVEPDSGVGLDVDFCLALADRHDAAEALAHAAREHHPEPEEENDRNDPPKEVLNERALHLARIGDAIFLKLVGKWRIDPGGHELGLAVWKRLLELPLNVTVRNRDLIDLVILQQLRELAVWDRLDLLRRAVEIL